MHNDVLPFYERHRAQGRRAILTDNGREFCGTDSHPFELYLALAGIEHRKTRVRAPRTYGFVERFNGTVLDEFFRVKIRETFYDSVEALQNDLRRLARPLQHRTAPSRIPKHGQKAMGNRQQIHQPRSLRGPIPNFRFHHDT